MRLVPEDLSLLFQFGMFAFLDEKLIFKKLSALLFTSVPSAVGTARVGFGHGNLPDFDSPQPNLGF
jgi:hypothetical protein